MITFALARARAGIARLGVRVTADQLYYATCRAVLPPLGLLPHRPGFLVPRPVPRAAFDRVLARVPDPDLVTARLPRLAGATDTPDLLDYGLPRLLICQHDGIAAMLLASDLHMDSATAVLGDSQVEAGLPALLTAAIRESTTVHLLHDATAAGAAWRADAQERIDVPGQVVSLGLRPDHARALHLVRGPADGAELAAVPPEILLRVLRRLLTGQAAVPQPRSVREHAGLGFLSWPGEPR